MFRKSYSKNTTTLCNLFVDLFIFNFLEVSSWKLNLMDYGYPTFAPEPTSRRKARKRWCYEYAQVSMDSRALLNVTSVSWEPTRSDKAPTMVPEWFISGLASYLGS